MGKLSADEQKALKALMDKAEAPDTAESAKSLNISIDLADENQVKRAQRLGLLAMFSDDEEKPEEGGEKKEGEEETPKRQGFFTS